MAVSSESILFVREMVKRRSALALDASKDYLIESRLGPLATDRGYPTIDAMVTDARNGEAALHTKIVEALVTHETSFFRDQHPFTQLQTTILPQLIKAREQRRQLRIWSAACSTGQEPYSLAMVVREIEALASWSVKIIGTDLSEPILTKARDGRYTLLEVNRGMPVQMLLKYFDREGAHYAVKDALRRLVEFRPLNLTEPLPALEPDIVFMRNVLIYFSLEDKRRILDNVRRILAPDGALFLGASETTLNVATGWEPVTQGTATYFRMTR